MIPGACTDGGLVSVWRIAMNVLPINNTTGHTVTGNRHPTRIKADNNAMTKGSTTKAKTGNLNFIAILML
jgi:hypothetical protein